MSKDVRNNHANQNLYFDEMMIPFSGGCPIKQYVPNKPNPVGLKVYVLSNPSGILCDLFVYEGRKKYPDDLKDFWECEKKYMSVTRPKCIKSHNKFMGGVDLADRMISYCPSRARTKKWTVQAILHIFDLALSNAWLQFREIKQNLQVPAKDIPQFRTFKMEFGRSLIENNHNLPLRTPNLQDDGRFADRRSADRRSTEYPSVEIRTQGALHLPDISTGVQKRCAAKNCKYKSTVCCIRCNVYLCLVKNTVSKNTIQNKKYCNISSFTNNKLLFNEVKLKSLLLTYRCIF